MTTEKYNGWTNYATWRVNLEVFDGMDIREYFDELPDAYDAGQWAKEYLEEHLEELVHEPSSRLVQDYALAFLANVDWQMIGRHLIENASEVEA